MPGCTRLPCDSPTFTSPQHQCCDHWLEILWSNTINWWVNFHNFFSASGLASGLLFSCRSALSTSCSCSCLATLKLPCIMLCLVCALVSIQIK